MVERSEGLGSKDVLPASVGSILETDPFFVELPTIKSVIGITNGTAHHVYQITSEDRRYYLKIRGDRFARVPSIACDPSDIVNEYTAICILHDLFPENFPEALSFSAEGAYMVLSDAIPDGELLEDLFLDNRVTPEMAFGLGSLLRQVHEETSGITEDIRPGGDNDHYEAKIKHRLGNTYHPALDEAAHQLRKGERQIILGDVAPKNIGIGNDGNTTIFDLEDVHRGNTVFDFSYLLGHIILHSFKAPEEAIRLIDEYYRGYGVVDFDQPLVKKIALGIILYRLNGIIPYPTNLSAIEEDILKEKIEKMLYETLEDNTWMQILDRLNND